MMLKKSLPAGAQDDEVANDAAVDPTLRNITDLLDTLLLGYDAHLRPDLGGEFSACISFESMRKIWHEGEKRVKL
jgi:hypothetical protein